MRLFSIRYDQILGIGLFIFTIMSPKSLQAQIVINEILASNQHGQLDEDGDASDWVEILNLHDVSINLIELSLSDDPNEPMKWRFPDTQLGSGQRILVWCSGKDRAGLSQEQIENINIPLDFKPTLFTRDIEWTYLSGNVDSGPIPTDWSTLEFDDAQWSKGQATIGFSRSEVPTEIPIEHTAILARAKFEFTGDIPNLVLNAQYDDGLVIFLNGQMIREINMDPFEVLTFGTEARRSHSFTREERIDLSESKDLLRQGENVLGVAVFNQRANSNDLLISAELGEVAPIFHSNFKLASEGGVVSLTGGHGQTEDLLEYPEQSEDQSYGRSPDGIGDFKYLLNPSPNAENLGPASDIPLLVRDTTFSIDRGFYTQAFNVEITTLTPEAQIWFTLDGTEPTPENGTLYEAPISIEKTTTLRARAFKEDHVPSNTDTQTYIFLTDIIVQSLQTAVAAGLPNRWGTFTADYAMDPQVIGPNDTFGGIYRETILDDLKSLPSMSIVMDPVEFFGPQGIYTNSSQGGINWERACSVEYFSPDGGPEFQVNCGIRIQGGFFRSMGATRKHSLRLLFKGIYGPTKLEFPLFKEDTAVERFDTITLRAGSNDGYSWNAARLTEQYTRDNFGRDLLRATGNASAHGTFVHLYINGVYWGLYNPVERPDHSFSSSYYGGDKEDWDAVHDGSPTNGSLSAWNQALGVASQAGNSLDAYMRLQGLNPDGTRNPEFPHLLDVQNYVDYLIVNLWGGNWDWPWKNWWAGRLNTPESTGFKFYCWDYENTIGNNRNRSPLGKNSLQNNFSSAGEFHTRLRNSPEYRQLFQDRAYKFFKKEGVLSPEALIPRYEILAGRIERAMVGESARWGDQNHATPLTLREWRNERDWILNSYLPQRTNVVIGQFDSAGFFTEIDPPTPSVEAGMVDLGTTIDFTVPKGQVLYTTDGTDPRLPGGDISPLAQVGAAGEETVLVSESDTVKVFVPRDDRFGMDWIEANFDDDIWPEGVQPLGYEERNGYQELINFDLHEQMFERNTSAYLRVEFDVTDPAAFAFLFLEVKYDDAFAAFINGKLIESVNVPEELLWNSEATRSHSDGQARVFETFAIENPKDVLVEGKNVLAIQALNRRANDSDFLFSAQLVGTVTTGSSIELNRTTKLLGRTLIDGNWSALEELDYVIDTNIPLRVTELMYHPADPSVESPHDADEFEFIELQNISSEFLDISEIQLKGGVEFDFSEASIRELEPGQVVLLVENLDAFETRYNTSSMTILGEYSGRLSNGSEKLTFTGFLGEPILEFEYDDAWYDTTDGDGPSLEKIDLLADRETWSRRTAWRASEQDFGSPGVSHLEVDSAGGRQRPGDINQDQRLNINDSIAILRLLFQGQVIPLPCEGETIASGGNRSLADLDGNGNVEPNDALHILRYLFLQGAPPELGIECTPIISCPDICAQ